MNSLFLKIKNSPQAKNFIKILSVDVLVRASAFLLLPVYLKLMTEDEFGLYTYLFSIITALGAIFNLGLYVPQSKYYHDLSEVDRKELIFNLHLILVSFFTFIILPIFLFNFDYVIMRNIITQKINYENYRWYLFLGIIVSVYSLMIQNYLVTSLKIKALQILNILKLIVIHPIVIVILYYSSEKVETRLAFSLIVEILLLAPFIYIFYIKNTTKHINLNTLRKIIKLAYPIFLSSIFGSIYLYADRVILEKYTNYSVLAHYNVAMILANIIMIVNTSVQNSYLPYFFSNKDLKSNLLQTKKIRNKLLIFYTVLSFFIVLGLFLLLQLNLIKISYYNSLYLLPILLSGSILNSISNLYGNYLTYFEKTSHFLLIGLLSSAISISLNFILIPLYGIWGATFSFFITNLAYLLLYYYSAKQKINKVQSYDEV